MFGYDRHVEESADTSDRRVIAHMDADAFDAARGEHDVGAQVGEGSGDGDADAGGCAGDDRDPAVERVD
jgi:hypothetical protein